MFYQNILKRLIRNIIYNFNDKTFCFFYNLISRLRHQSKNYLINDGEKFILKEKNFKWSFSHKKRGFIYLNGIWKRGKELHKKYKIQNIKFKNDDIVIDIGANVGDFYLGFEQKIKYYAYEPSPKCFSCLVFNIKNQNLYNLGVSNSEIENIDFYLKDESADSSILPINDYDKKISIETTTLDREIDKIQQRIKLIKLEAEGYEPEILQELKKNLNFVEYITVDCGFERGIKRESTIAECSNYLIKNNFKMIDFGSSSARIIALFKNLNT